MMTRDEFGCFLFGAMVGAFLIVGTFILDNDRNRAKVIEKYKSGEIVCAEVGEELVCRSAK